MEYSALILTNNEQAHIGACIENIKPLVRDIIVIDDYSQDLTPEIAETSGATVIQRPLARDWASQRNFGLEQVSESWTLVVDADERLDEVAKASVLNFAPSAETQSARLNRLNYYKDKALRNGRFRQDLQHRLLRSDLRYDPARPVHERPIVGENGTVVLPGTIQHLTYASLSELLHKMRFYSEIEAESGQREQKYCLPIQIARRLGRIPLQKAYKDGLAGFINVGAEIYGDVVLARAERKLRKVSALGEAKIAFNPNS
jgi:glycosyltransferase involved in cell wall biosynthesis